MILASVVALFLENALQAFNILLQIGAGTGLLFILRWFWWRINAISEIAAMIISFIVAVMMQFAVGDALAGHWQLVIGVAITTVTWILVTLFTPPTSINTLISFFKLIRPYGYGWKPVIEIGTSNGAILPEHLKAGKLPVEITMMLLGCVLVYGLLFGTGYLIYGQITGFIICLAIVLACSFLMYRLRMEVYTRVS